MSLWIWFAVAESRSYMSKIRQAYTQYTVLYLCLSGTSMKNHAGLVLSWDECVSFLHFYFFFYATIWRTCWVLVFAKILNKSRNIFCKCFLSQLYTHCRNKKTPSAITYNIFGPCSRQDELWGHILTDNVNMEAIFSKTRWTLWACGHIITD